MVTVARMIEDLRARGVTLALVDGELRYRAAQDGLTAADKASVAARRSEIVGYLAALASSRRGPMRLSRKPAAPSLLQEMWWNWYGRPPRQLNQERLTLTRKFDGVSRQLLERAVAQLIRRHETLRTSFREENGRLALTLNPVDGFESEFSDLSDFAGARERELQQQVAEFGARQLPIDGQWLMRSKVIALSASEFVVSLVFHHIIFDANSLFLVLAELETLLAPSAGALPPVPAQFTDYVAWERGWVQDEARQPLIDYWAHWLRNQVSLVAPESKRTLQWQPGRKVDHKFSLGANILRKLNACAVELHTSLFNVLLTVFGVTLSRWSGQERFPVRCIGDLRTSPELASMVGYLVCSDVVEINVPPDTDFVEQLRSNEIEYHSAILLRLPILLRHPLHDDGRGVEDPRRIAATINMFSAGRQWSEKLQQDAGDPGDESWPPQVHCVTPGEDWPVLLPTIYLRLLDFGTFLQGALELNGSMLSLTEQASLLTQFFAVTAEVAARVS